MTALDGVLGFAAVQLLVVAAQDGVFRIGCTHVGSPVMVLNKGHIDPSRVGQVDGTGNASPITKVIATPNLG